MKRKIELCMTLLLLIGMIIVSKKLSEVAVSGIAVQQEKVIVVDAGHGGEDPGKVGVNGVLEKDLNLQIALKLKEEMERNGISVIMTRQDDNVPEAKLEDMKQRVELINKVQPAIVVSVHQNSYSDGSVCGAQVFYFSHSEQGKEAALMMQQELRQMDSQNTRQAKSNDTFYLLRKTEVPTIIVECGFLSNAQEAEKLTQEEYQRVLAETICASIVKYLDKN